MSVTTDAEMLAAVERWAKARGHWYEIQASRRLGWHVSDHGSYLHVWHRFGELDTQTRSYRPGVHTLLLWACTVETTETLTSPPMPSEAEARAWAAARVMSGRMEIIRPQGVSARRPGEPREFVARVTRPLAVDVGRCPACAGDGVNRSQEPAEGVVLRFECPDCKGTGRELREVARLVLDAAPRPGVDKTVIEGGFRLDSTVLPGDPQARDRLAVAADQLQAAGERLGTWHALGLAGKDDAAGEMVAWLHERPPAASSSSASSAMIAGPMTTITVVLSKGEGSIVWRCRQLDGSEALFVSESLAVQDHHTGRFELPVDATSAERYYDHPSDTFTGAVVGGLAVTRG